MTKSIKLITLFIYVIVLVYTIYFMGPLTFPSGCYTFCDKVIYTVQGIINSYITGNYYARRSFAKSMTLIALTKRCEG